MEEHSGKTISEFVVSLKNQFISFGPILKQMHVLDEKVRERERVSERGTRDAQKREETDHERGEKLEETM